MKRIALYIGLAAAMVASCSTQEKDFQTPLQDDVVFYASFEQPVDEGTRVYANEDLLLRWTADDRVSIFNKNSYNQQYRFTGETGDNAGGFDKVEGSEFTTGNVIAHVVSVYPYLGSTKISESEALTVTLPAEQHYAEDSFGLGANTMVSVSEDNVLQYKSVGGFLRISLYGEGVSVSSITLKGNNGEKLAGKATITMPMDGTPSVSMADDATDTITIICDSPVTLGAIAEESVDFWFVVPPVTFSQGFQVTVSGNRGIFEKTTEKAITIERNNVSKMSPVEAFISQPSNVIYYTSLDGEVITLYSSEAFGANIISNEYIDGRGIITFDGNLTQIGDRAFQARNLTSIVLPDSVTSIGEWSFGLCSNLYSITLPKSLQSIGEYAFSGCSNLYSISLPQGLRSIGDYAFSGCGFMEITIPDSVSSFGSFAFSGCFSLKSFCGKYASSNGIYLIDSGSLISVAPGSANGHVSIPDDVLEIATGAFYYCPNLDSVYIPDSVRSIGDFAFYCCYGLSSIIIPDSVLDIGKSAFAECVELTTIKLSNNITRIKRSTFGSCKKLASIIIPEGVTCIEEFAFSGCAFPSIIIPNKVTSIEAYAFLGCADLTSITIPDCVTSIGNEVFNDCENLVSVLLPNDITSISDGMFYGCKSLTSIVIPNAVSSIGDCAFSDCISLSSVVFPEGLESVGDSAFSNCKSLKSVTFPDNLQRIGYAAFDTCSNLTNVSISKSVSSIDDYAFVDCSRLSTIIVLPPTPPSGKRNMFLNTNNAPIYVPLESVEAYKRAEFWSDYSGRIQAISE